MPWYLTVDSRTRTGAIYKTRWPESHLDGLLLYSEYATARLICSYRLKIHHLIVMPEAFQMLDN